ncbi:MAG: MATE family efflux transporter [Oscillospiraceae bacterium]
MNLFVKDKSYYKQLILLALPLIGQAMINQGVNMMDTIMLGSFGEIPISGSALANQFYFIFMIFHFGLAGGASVLTGQFWGRQEIAHIRGVITLALRISVCVALVMSALSYFCGESIMLFYTPDVAIIEAGAKYMRIMAFGYLMHGVSLTLAIIYRTVHLVKLAFFSSLVSFFVNIFFNWMFIFGTLGAPRMEIEGAALGTVLARASEFLIIVGYVFFFDKRVGYRLRSLLLPVREYLRSFLKSGAPVIISDAMLAFGENMLAMVMGQMGGVMVAANSITAVVVQICTVFNMGLSGASSVMTGNTVGAGEYERAEREGVTFFVLSIFVGLLSAGIILLIKPLVIGMYNVADETKLLADSLLNVIAVIMVFQTSGGVLTKGVLRGGGDTRFLMIADVAFLWLASIPLGAIAGLALGWDPVTVYFLLKIDLVIKAVWCIFRLYSKKWIHLVKVEV